VHNTAVAGVVHDPAIAHRHAASVRCHACVDHTADRALLLCSYGGYVGGNFGGAGQGELTVTKCELIELRAVDPEIVERAAAAQPSAAQRTQHIACPVAPVRFLLS
jgi:hypothetical protein